MYINEGIHLRDIFHLIRINAMAGIRTEGKGHNKMKRSLTILMMIVLTVLFCASIVKANTIEIGIAWAGKSGMAKRVAKGFEEGVKELNLDVKIEFHEELDSVDELAAVVSRWEKEKQGMVLLRSNAAKWLAKNPPTIPTFIGGCNHPSQLGAVKNLQAPEGNITGVTYYLPVATQFEVFQEIIPDLKSVLLLLEKGHPSSLIDQEGTQAVCRKLGIRYNEKFSETREETIAAVKQYRGRVSAIIIGNQALIFDDAQNIVAAADETPVLSYSYKPVKVGALGGFVADDTKLGYMLALSVADVLTKGKTIKTVPVKVDPDPKFYVNANTALRLQIEIPFHIIETATVIE
jgi:putative ABC transport system substrate-binding protein